jgi:glycosyltransferase involved in cell wall biosynthesis
VLLEALASGLPVAAFPVMGPKDIITASNVGILSDDLQKAAMQALRCNREACVTFAEGWSWRASTGQFARNMREACHRFAESAARKSA